MGLQCEECDFSLSGWWLRVQVTTHQSCGGIAGQKLSFEQAFRSERVLPRTAVEVESSLERVLLCSWNKDGWKPVLSEKLDFYDATVSGSPQLVSFRDIILIFKDKLGPNNNKR